MKTKMKNRTFYLSDETMEKLNSLETTNIFGKSSQSAKITILIDRAWRIHSKFAKAGKTPED